MINLRRDLKYLLRWIRPNTHVLDLGCGDGSLLSTLAKEKNAVGYGIEIDNPSLLLCIQDSINVIQADINNGLNLFADNQFDYVIMTQTLQAMQNPKQVLHNMLRIGRECIVTFPNFGYWLIRAHLLLSGTMPVSRSLPYSWYETPNIHLCTVRDFVLLCREEGISILHTAYLNTAGNESIATRFAPNLLSSVALYHVKKTDKTTRKRSNILH